MEYDNFIPMIATRLKWEFIHLKYISYDVVMVCNDNDKIMLNVSSVHYKQNRENEELTSFDAYHHSFVDDIMDEILRT